MSYLNDLWEDFLSLLYPRLCYACGNHLARDENLICTECYIMIPRTGYHVQPDNPVEKLFWGRCRIEKAAAFSFYNRGSRIRTLIHNFKYKGVKDIGHELGRIYGLTLKGTDFLSDIDLIIPVPLHPKKMHVRGFNQSDIISQGISETTGIPVNMELLSRVAISATQTKKSRYDRWTNVEGIFNVKDTKDLKGMHVLLVDDVITTGSTIESCATELLKTKDVRVSVAALAVAPL
jgi:ComF family protein